MTSQTKKATRPLRKVRQGVVLSNKADKMIVVRINSKIKHPVYGKFMKRSKKLYAHDEKNECNVGDVVRIIEVRPLSKLKRWALVSVVEKVK